MLSLTELPVDLLLDNVLPVLPIASVLRLSQTSKFFGALATDETYWKRRLRDDFNFDPNSTARRSGWRTIYKGLSKPAVYTWGENRNGRLGQGNSLNPAQRVVPFPVKVNFPEKNTRIVSLVAGGMSFHAVDRRGQVYVWGTLNGERSSHASEGFSHPGQTAHTPHRLKLPHPIRSISCGRLHTLFMTPEGLIYTLLSWGRPFTLHSRFLATDPELSSFPVQVEAGWTFGAALTRSGRVLVWWPFSGRLGGILARKGRDMDNAGKAATPDGHVIPCDTFEVRHDPMVLPDIPPLPHLPHTTSARDVKLVRIAGLDNAIVGLTNLGHVLVFNKLANQEMAVGGHWEYLPKFSHVEEVQQLRAFNPDNVPCREKPTSMYITHISGHFRTLIAYSSSMVLTHSNPPLGPRSTPQVLPILQERTIIAVAPGDWHDAALTGNGELLTWGQFSLGALGLGDPALLDIGVPGGCASVQQRVLYRTRGWRDRAAIPSDVRIPQKVKFDGKEKGAFVVGVAAAGWHTGALVIKEDYAEERSTDENDPRALGE